MGTLYEIHVEVFAPQDYEADAETIDANESELMAVLDTAARGWCEAKSVPFSVTVAR